MSDYSKLQNGSDIRGVALPGVPGEDVNLDSAAAAKIGAAFARWLEKKAGSDDKANRDAAGKFRVAVGRDPRLSGADLAASLKSGLEGAGAAVVDCGLASTPAMFMSTQFDAFKCRGAVMITASHLPFNRNGFKFFTAEGGLNKEDIKEILAIASSIDDEQSFGEGATGNSQDAAGALSELMEEYCAHLRGIIMGGLSGSAAEGQASGSPLAGLKIVVDAGNGAGGFYADHVLAPLGAEVTGCFLEPDGNFPNHIPNPENAEAMASICSAVKDHGADLGIIFDTDVDRSAAVDENGKEIARNGIVALAAALVSEKHPGTTVVTDSITSDELSVFLEESLGMKHLRFKRGYKNVINKAIELNDAGEASFLAIETSGHAAIKDNYFLDDGAYLATLIVIKAAQLRAEGKGISTMISSLAEPEDACEVRMKINSEDFGAIGDRILADLKAAISVDAGSTMGAAANSDSGAAANNSSSDAALGEVFSLVEPNYEGVRANYNDGEVSGWFLLRKSLHDPIMPLNIEANQKDGCKVIAAALKDFLSKYPELDSTGL